MLLGVYLAVLHALLIAADNATGEVPDTIQDAIGILMAAALAVGEPLRQRAAGN